MRYFQRVDLIKLTMERFTTEAPWWIVMDETDDFNFTEIEPFVVRPNVVHERLAIYTILFLLGVVTSLSLLITVIRTKSVRSQLLGVMLIHMAVSIFVRTMVFTREMETESRGGIGNFGTVGCHLYFIGYMVSSIVFNAAFVTICLDTTFTLPQSRRAQVIATICISVFAITFTVIMLYGLGMGPEVQRDYGQNMCVFYMRVSYVVREIVDQIIYHLIPTLIVLVTLIRFCCTHSTNKSTEGKKLPLVLTALIYLVTMWALQVVYNLQYFYMYLWFYMIAEFGHVVMALLWLSLTPDLRNKCFCRKTPDDESIQLLK